MRRQDVTFDISSVERIFQDPEIVLEDVEGFWQKQAPYMAAKRWEPPGYPISLDKFEDKVVEIAAQNQETRDKHECYVFAKRFMETAHTFRAKGLDHVRSYLPQETVLQANIFLACFIYLGQPEPRFSPTGFVNGQDIVFNADPKYWNSQPSVILHEVTHELFHVGYHWLHETPRLQDAHTNQALLKHIAWQLQNEGMATHVAYTVRDVLPTQHNEIYPLIDDLEKVKNLLSDVNALIGEAFSQPPSEMSDTIIDRGISKYGFYVVGATMAQKIEKELGQDTLVSSVAQGPQHFLALYNSIVKDEWKIDPRLGLPETNA